MVCDILDPRWIVVPDHTLTNAVYPEGTSACRPVCVRFVAKYPGTCPRESPSRYARVLLGDVWSSEPFEDITLPIARGLCLGCVVGVNDVNRCVASQGRGLTLSLGKVQLIKFLNDNSEGLSGRKLTALDSLLAASVDALALTLLPGRE